MQNCYLVKVGVRVASYADILWARVRARSPSIACLIVFHS